MSSSSKTDRVDDATISSVTERTRILVLAMLGIVVGSAIGALGIGRLPWQFAVLGAWDISAAVFLVWVWLTIRNFDPDRTARYARREDDSRAGARLLLVISSTVSLVGVGFAFVKANESFGALAIALTICGIVSVILSWAVVHLVHTLRYAHLYYSDPEGGISFPGNDAPGYQDFAYLAFTVGMTYQVSDNEISDKTIRRTVLYHSLLSYMFGTAVIAVMINIVAGFLK